MALELGCRLLKFMQSYNKKEADFKASIFILIEFSAIIPGS